MHCWYLFDNGPKSSNLLRGETSLETTIAVERLMILADFMSSLILDIDLNLRDQRGRLRIGKIMRRLGWDYRQVRVGKSKSRKWVKGK